MKWTNTCRYGNLREYEYSQESNRLTIQCHNVLYYSFSLDNEDHVVSIDPDGGPTIAIGGIIPQTHITIRDIVSHAHKRLAKLLIIILDVTENN